MRIFRRILAGLLVLLLLALNVGVHRAPSIGKEEERAQLLSQLEFLEKEMHTDLGDRMQQLFPEGYLFSNLLFGLTWCGLVHGTEDPKVREHALQEAEWAYAAVSTPDARALFDGAMLPMNGAFYNGWRNFLLARVIEAEGSNPDPALVAEFDSLSVNLADAFGSSASPFLASYPKQAWPADNVVAIASVALHQQIRGVDHHAVIARWVRQVRLSLDPAGAIAHQWDMEGAALREGARGSSQSLMNCFLPLIDRALAKEQYAVYSEKFLDSRLGVPMVREYPKGSSGKGDVDSGPVIFGVGFSATIVGSGACRMNNDACAAAALDGTIEGFGVPNGEHKHYVFGALPIADLFITWTRSMQAKDTCAHGASFLVFHLCSVVVAALLWAPTLIGLWKRR